MLEKDTQICILVLWGWDVWPMIIFTSAKTAVLQYSRNPHKGAYIFWQQPVKSSYFCRYNQYIRDGGDVSWIKTSTDCISIAVPLSSILFLRLLLSKY